MRGVRQGRITTWSRATSTELYAPRRISEAVNWRNLGDVRMPFKKLLLAAALATAAVATQAHADALDSIMKSKVIKIAVPQDFAPFGSAGLDLKPQGYDIDMANLIGKELGVKTEIIPVTSANRIPYLQTNKADLVISSLGKNEEREKVIDFSIAYAPFFSGVFGTKAIAVTIAAFVAGQVDLIATGNTVAAAIAEKVPARAPALKFVIKDSPCYVGLNKNEPALLAKVDEIITKAKASGDIAKLSEKWLKAPLPPGF